jgi:hypothetical protein
VSILKVKPDDDVLDSGKTEQTSSFNKGNSTSFVSHELKHFISSNKYSSLEELVLA